jgi:hypothetical protein
MSAAAVDAFPGVASRRNPVRWTVFAVVLGVNIMDGLDTTNRQHRRSVHPRRPRRRRKHGAMAQRQPHLAFAMLLIAGGRPSPTGGSGSHRCPELVTIKWKHAWEPVPLAVASLRSVVLGPATGDLRGRAVRAGGGVVVAPLTSEAARPADVRPRAAGSSPPDRSRMLADSHVPAAAWTSIGCSG